MLTLKQVIDAVLEHAVKNDIIVHQYKAKTSNSVYLKFDFGVLNTLRVSDHKGKRKYPYKYELSSHRSETVSVKKFYKGNEFYVYKMCFDDLDLFLDILVEERNEKLAKFGESGYAAILKKKQHTSVDDSYFYRRATLVV